MKNPRVRGGVRLLTLSDHWNNSNNNNKMFYSNAIGCSLISMTIMVVTQLATLRHVTGTFPMLCGDDLVNAVAMVCQDRGYYVQPNKRSVTSELPGVFQAETRAKSFLKSALFADENGRMRRRVRSGLIVNECCISRCSVGIIESYCNPWPDESSHSESAHVRLGKSAEQAASQQSLGRPQDGLAGLDNRQNEESDGNTAAARGRNRVESVQEVLSERIAAVTPSNSKKTRKDKSQRRKTSREAKAARREERRRNRELSSGGKSRAGRRKNKATDRSPRAKRSSPFPWETSFETENTFSFFNSEVGSSTADLDEPAPLTTKVVAVKAESPESKGRQSSARSSENALPVATDQNVRERRSKESSFISIMRVFVSNFAKRK